MAVVATLMACGLGTASADDWSQFRGKNASGVAAGTAPLPVEFSYTEKVKWSAEPGEGVSSPIVCRGRAITTAMVGEETFAVFCYDADTGELVWKREFETGPLPRITPPNSHASSTPASDGERVYVHFSTLGLMALDLDDGTQIWNRPIRRAAYLMDWGAAASPIVYKDLVLFNQDDDLAPCLYAVDSATGEIRWTAERPDMLAGYATPVVAEVDGRAEIVVAGSGKLKGYDPETGKELWTCNTLVRTIMTSPVVKDGIIYIAVQSYGDDSRTLKYALLEWLDTNQDGKLTRAEVPKEFQKRFDQSDKDHDAVLQEAELDTAFQSADNLVGGGSLIQAIRAGGSGDVTKTHLLWNIENRSPSNLSSPLVVGEQLFVIKKGGLSSSFDIKTGQSHWELSRTRNIGDYFASPVAGDGKIYVTGQNGFMVVLRQGPKLKVLSKNDLGEDCIATPAIADGRLYVRTRHKLYCFAEESP